MFLNEGIKIYFRMVYALLNTFKAEILQYNDATTLKTYIRKMSINMKKSKVEKMIKSGFGLRLVKVKHELKKYDHFEEDSEQLLVYYLPTLS